ncbi:hypothetical protein PV726_27715 [Streptomyces europaeiscabiei]|uniref:hypothetical protein n=1 Tax=Streptomyces europaeiscabiei TaxID=146819 RepID=UPI0029A35CEB|nr:hypothetical protein [Streptomyces europaeiscabiei]MDX3694056.1 hypothetical protein [Streptomyces europaeiscabiei]
MADSKDDEILTKIQGIRTRLTDQSANGLVTRAHLDQKIKPTTEKKSDATKDKGEEKPPPGMLDQFFEATGLKPVIEAFKSGGWILGAGAILTAVGVKLIDFEILFSGVLNKFGRQLKTSDYGLPRIMAAPPEPVVAEASSQADKLQKLNKAAEDLTSSLRELSTAMQQAENRA